MEAIEKTAQFLDNLNDWIGRALSFGVLFMFVLVITEVGLRYLFNSPTVWTNELTQMIFGAYVILSGGYILRWNGHVNVDILYIRFSPRGRALLDVITFGLFAAFAVMMLVYGGYLAFDSMAIWEHSESAWNPPLWPAKLTIPLGALLLLLQGLVKLSHDLTTLLTGRKAGPEDTAEKETL